MGGCLTVPPSRDQPRDSLVREGGHASLSGRSDPGLPATALSSLNKVDEAIPSLPSDRLTTEEESEALSPYRWQELTGERLQLLRTHVQQRRRDFSHLEQATRASLSKALLKVRVPGVSLAKSGVHPQTHPIRLHCRGERATNRLLFWTFLTLVLGNILWSFIRGLIVYLFGGCYSLALHTITFPRVSRSSAGVAVSSLLSADLHNTVRSSIARLYRLWNIAKIPS